MLSETWILGCYNFFERFSNEIGKPRQLESIARPAQRLGA